MTVDFPLSQNVAYRERAEYDDMKHRVQQSSFTPQPSNREKDDHVRMHAFLPATHLNYVAHTGHRYVIVTPWSSSSLLCKDPYVEHEILYIHTPLLSSVRLIRKDLRRTVTEDSAGPEDKQETRAWQKVVVPQPVTLQISSSRKAGR